MKKEIAYLFNPIYEVEKHLENSINLCAIKKVEDNLAAFHTLNNKQKNSPIKHTLKKSRKGFELFKAFFPFNDLSTNSTRKVK